jgi:glycosyltransferase involved in cell wall biosynthesis
MKVSIVMPVYNGSNYIRRSLESVFDQNSRGLEIIVVDDGSTDETASIVRSLFQEKKSQEIRCRLVYQKNQGVSVARNVGLKNASGDYVFFLDADDLINPDCIGKLYKRAMDTAAEISIL